MPQGRHVFVTGGTGYVGTRLIRALTTRGHRVTALVRTQHTPAVPTVGDPRLPPTCTAVVGDALRADTYGDAARGCDTLVQLVGTPHPAPWKRDAFRRVDLASGLAAVDVVREAGIPHLVYVSVAQPAPIMRAYIEVRAEVEAAIAQHGLNATILRPWYVLGPGHRWPAVLAPLYRLLATLPATRAAALRLGLVTIAEMVAALTWAVEHPAVGRPVVDAAGIRELALALGAPDSVC